MNSHLNDEQFGDLLLGCAPDDAGHRHLAECASCRGELARIKASLTGLQQATTGYAALRTPAFTLERQDAKAGTAQRAGWRAGWTATLATGCALAALLIGFSQTHTGDHRREPVHAGPTVAADVSTSDAALMNDIEQDVSTSVPPALAPLAIPVRDAASSREN